MTLSDELDKLDRLHRQGSLSDDEFIRAKARVLGGGGAPPCAGAGVRIDALRRSRDDRWLGGVCGGLGALTGVQAWIWRVLFVLAVACSGAGIAAYLLLWIFVPDAGSRHDAARA